MENKKFYLTTPIYYPSGNWHLGHSYTTVIADCLARFKRMQNFDVFFLTGTDEHGQKIEERAKASGKTPKEFVDGLVDNLKELWKLMNISYDKFIRTTDEYHVEAVQKIFKKLYDKGDIYKSEYEGWYCTPCESFWTKSQLKDGKCPDCGREVKLTKEESYFFRLSKYQDRILKLYEENPEFLQPVSRVNEMKNNFLLPGLQDLAVSRTTFKWGVPVTFDDKHIVYVWVDALSNYITALGYGSGDTSKFDSLWPADVHLMAKEIVRFHAIIWPALLMALDLPLPKRIYGHGWLLFGGDKMSKSKGNVADPFKLCNRYGVDAIRYYLLKEIPFGQDAVYSDESLLKAINSDLCNDLGNLVSRTAAMIKQYFGGDIPSPSESGPEDEGLIETVKALYGRVSENMDALQISQALGEIMKAVQRANKYIDETAPWALSKDLSKRERLKTVLYNLAETIRVAALLLKPYLPSTPDRIYAVFGLGNAPDNFESIASGKLFDGSIAGAKADAEAAKLFPRLDIKKELAELSSAEEKNTKKDTKNEVKESDKMDEKDKNADNGMITIDDFFKTQLVTAKILTAEKVEKADKLLKFTLDTGDGTRTVVSGIAQYYSPEELIGRTVVLVKNLKPVKLRGILSEGMLLCASDEEGRVRLVTPDGEVTVGCEVR